MITTAAALTNDATPVITGTAEAGATVIVSNGTTQIGSAVVGADGSFSLTPVALPEGTASLTAVVVDAAGNISLASAPKLLVVDLTAPTAASVALATDTGSSSSDRVTSNAGLTLSAAASDVTRTYTVDGGTATGTYAPPTFDGLHTVLVTDTDAAGNVANASLTFTLDTLAPNAVADLVTSIGTQAALTGNILLNDTDANTFQFVSLNGTSVGNSLDVTGAHGNLHIEADGTYSYQPFGVGSDQFIYAVADLAGNTSTQTLSIDVHGNTSDTVTDLILRNPNTGQFTKWQADGNGFIKDAYVDASVSTDWKLEAVSDFNGDGKADLLWRHAGGTFTEWQSTGSGYTPNTYVDGSVGTDWQVAGTGDFNGDGKADILWKNAAAGVITEWQSTGNGFTPNTFVGSVNQDLHLQAIADFNGDGKADLLWRTASGTFSEWQSTGNGFTQDVYVNASVGTDWHVAGTGDFNGDSKADILWRNDNGVFTEWQSTGSSFTPNTYVDGSVSTDWQIVQISDFNRDGKADLLWKNDTAHVVTQWQSTGNGFTPNTYVSTIPRNYPGP